MNGNEKSALLQEVRIIKICNATGCGICCRCDGIPPVTNGYSCGDICKKVVQNIIDYLEDGDLYKFSNGKLYRVTIGECQFYEEDECEINNIK